MAPARKSRNVNKRYSYTNEGSPSKDGDGAKKNNSRKRKLSDLLGPRWTMDELTRFYDAYRKYGPDWKKVMGAVRHRSLEMVEALYTMNRAYLSLPHGTASAAGLIAMMTDHYSNLGGSDSDQESNDGAGSARKSQKRARSKAQPTTSKALDEQLISNSQNLEANYGCLSLLKKKRSGGSRPRPVGKRTPRFPVSFSYENAQGEKYFSPTRQGLNIKANANDDDVAHEVAITLAEVSQRGGSPQVSRTPSKRDGSAMSSPFGHAERKHSVAEANARLLGAGMDEEDLEGSTEADTAELSRYKLDKMESVTAGMSTQKGRKVDKKKFEDDDNYLDDIKEECSGTGEGRRLSEMRGKFDVEVAGANTSKSSMQDHRNKSKKVLFGGDEDPTFDALQTLAAMSLMMPVDNEDESRVEFKDEDDDHVDESMPLEAPRANQHKTTRKSLGVRMKGHQPISSMEVASSKPLKHGKGSATDVSSAPEEIQPSHLDAKRSRKKQKMPTKKPEAHSDIHLSESLGVEVGGEGKKIVTKSRKSSQNSFSKLMKISENSPSADLRKEGSDSTHSAMDVSVVNPVNLPTKSRSRRKMDLKQPETQKDLRFPDKISSDQINVPFASLSDRALSFKEKLSNCLSNEHLRRWCTYEWFYSAIDYPWFAKREFVEYLDHVGLGHVPTLTRVEWGVIRSSLGKPRRFSEQFLKEEKEKLNQYRDSVRKHYTELREGVREGLPTDLARPLSVGQRVIAIHPKTREIHDGSVLTVDHSRCRVQFDRPELGVEFVMDIDCMPSNPFENIPALHEKSTVSLDKFFENFNEMKVNGLAKEYMKLSPGDNLDSIDGISQLSPLANPANLLKQTKVASTNVNGQTRVGPVDSATYQSAAYSQNSTLAHIQAKEADVQALSELNRALDKKEAIVLELRQMNDDVFENQKEGDGSLKDSEPFKMQYAGVLIKLNEANDQVSSALHCLRDRNTYQGNNALTFARSVTSLADHGDRSACQTQESGSNVNEIMHSSRSKAQTMVDAAVQAISTLKGREDSFDKIEEAIDYVNDRLPSDDSFTPMQAPDSKSMNAPGVETQIPSDMITKCVATLLMIQKCTERQFPPSDVAQILDSAVTSLQPRSSQNLPVYNEIQKCMGIIRNQILALIPT